MSVLIAAICVIFFFWSLIIVLACIIARRQGKRIAKMREEMINFNTRQ